jgi:hypothetical protein
MGLWCDCDSAGRGVAEPRILKGAIWPLDDDITPEIIAEHLAELENEHLTLYEVDGERYYEIDNFEKHQAASYRQGDAKYPDPSEGEVCTPARATCTPKGAQREGKGREGKRTDVSAARHSEPPDDFAEFWQQYPRKTDRKKAANAWKRLSKADKTAALGAIAAHRSMWEREHGSNTQFVPHGSTWINARRWEDEIGGKAKPSVQTVDGARIAGNAL